MTTPATWVTACIPTFRCTMHLRDAVASLLNQTHRCLRVVVINDGDPEPPWPALADFADPRLLRFDLGENRGPYFALAVALAATPDPFFAVQDADDWSTPHRVETLLQLLERDGSHYAFSTLAQFHNRPNGAVVVDRPLGAQPPDTSPGAELANRLFHHGVYRTEAVRNLGGYFAGFRFGYDMLLTNLLLLVGSVSWTPEALYWRRLRPDSLTRAPSTGMRSAIRRQLRTEMNALYRQAYGDYLHFRARRISGRQLRRRISGLVQAHCGLADRRRIKEHAARLRAGMDSQSRFHWRIH
jgi:glycosyltransferase involved in cell wall biosynthesis